MRRIKRQGCQHWRLLKAALVLTVLLSPDLGAATDLTVDNTLFNSPYALKTDINFDNEISGSTSTGIMDQSGFTNTVTDKFYLGYSPGSRGTYNLSGTGSLAAPNQYVGNSGNGCFNQSGGANVGWVLSLGNLSGSSGVYNLSGGSLSIVGEIIGDFGSGLFSQTGGTHAGNGNLILGNSAGGDGTYNQSGGINTVDGIIFLGRNQGSSGAYNLSNGSLAAGFGFLGYYGLGVFNQSGGSAEISYNFQMGYYAGSSGTYNLSGGSLVTSALYVGKEGSAVFNQSGGSNTVVKTSGVSSLYLGYYPGGSGTYNLSGGSLSAPAEAIGVLVGGIGVFNQSGGSNGVTGLLSLGYRDGSNGTYNLSGGSVLAVYEAMGYQGLGAFNQSGGSNTTSDLSVGDWTSGKGSYNLSGGSLVTNNTIIGNWGAGTFTQTGGSHTVAGALTLPAIPGRSGTYNLQGGSLTAGTINLNTGGLFNQTGGTLDFTTFNQVGGTCTFNSLYLGRKGADSSSYTLSGGNITAGNEYIGDFGTGAFTQSGGNHIVTDTLFLAANPGSSGTYNLTGGLLSANSIKVNPGAHFIRAGGTLICQDMNLQGGDYSGDLVNQGLLMGTGPLIGNVTNAGTVNPGHSPGTLSIVGSYTQTTTGTYTAEIASAGNYDRINVTGGTATLGGAIAPSLLYGYRPRGNQVFPDVLTASGGLIGNFDTIVNQQFTPTLFWQTRYNPGSVDLWVQRSYVNPSLNLNANQQGVGTMLNGVAGATSGDIDAVLNAIDYLPNSAGVRDAYKQISPEKAGSLTGLGFAAATFQMRNLATRTTNMRFLQGANGGGSSLNAGGLSFSYSKLDGLMLAYNGASMANLFSPRKEFQAPESRWGLYLDGGAAFGSQNSSINQTGYTFTLGGLTAGADYRLRDNLLVGLATGYSNTNSSFSGSGGSATTNTLPFNAYAAYFPGSLYAYGSLGYALNLYNLNRSISFNGLSRSATSSTTGNQFNLYGETGYDLRLSRVILTPSATLTCSALWVGGFTETGAGALNLKVGPQNASSVQTGLGGRLTVPLKVGPVKVVPQGYAFYQHEYANGSRGLNASLSQGSSSFTFKTDAAKRNFALVGASVTAGLGKNLYAQVNYSAEVGRTGSSAQTINVGLRYEF